MLFLVLNIASAETDIKVILKSIEEKHKDVQSFQADFTQTTQNDAFPEPVIQTGHMYAQKPKSIRWDFLTPMVQSYYSDGSQITTWDELNNQVLISNASQDGNNVFDVLTDLSSVSDKYTMSVKEERADVYVISVAPSEKLPFDRLELNINKEKLFVSKIYYSDKDTGTVEVKFSNITLNSSVDPKTFQFTPPKGAQVVDLRE